ncbi:replication-associated recombination protein A [Candidatus Falkowbacteria bacterium]|nr:replication-associated recombination protein A [Bacteroidales bacterium]MDD4176774.1 replication-associated recombination protein A [Bacteroidales bacterium]MDD4741122.1 replication-associated recombination protein A [Bacteroidales bacterium]NCU35349.1 replication-associated recombination protein A [Candidatus Falkowbacteria bacterium]
MNRQKPLAEMLRPESLEGYIGQEHLLGEGAILQRSIRSGSLPSMILWGPPGVGKTTLAYIISQTLKRPFYTLSAVNSGVKEVRGVIEKAKDQPGAILFIDEIHRFSKSQQDSLLGAVETGIITLIGATTENPSFEVISPLLSRCQVYILKSLDEKHLRKMLESARLYLSQSLGREIIIDEDEALLRVSGGDARKLFNAIELVVKAMLSESEIRITNGKVLDTIQQNIAMYDKGGEQHYDVISAFIKSIRGSDPNAAVYWLARMIAGGEDPKFIARRLVILASEDVGNANPNALLLANACFDAINKIGWPEGRIILSQTAVYLATSPKSNATYLAINEALALVEKTGDLPVPLHLRNAPTKLMKNIGYGKEYKYAHAFEGNFALQDFLPDKIANTRLYDPGKNAREEEVRKWLKGRWKYKYGY